MHRAIGERGVQFRCARRRGPVSAAEGSPGIVGSGTSFTTQYAAGGRFWVNDNASTGWTEWTILSVSDDTHLTLTENYNGTSGAGYQHAYLSPAVHPGAWKWADSGFGGWGEQAWHVGILMEGIINYDVLSGGSPQAEAMLLSWLAEVQPQPDHAGGLLGRPHRGKLHLLRSVHGVCPAGRAFDVQRERPGSGVIQPGSE